MTRDKQFYIRRWKDQLDADPRSRSMTDEAWYSSFAGLAFRLFYAHQISFDELRKEIG